VIAGGVTARRARAAARSLALVARLLAALRLPHPPAAATALIITLGIVHEPRHFPVLLGAVVALLVEGYVIERFVGVRYPLWAPERDAPRTWRDVCPRRWTRQR
jgi:CBS-domain-containing membrane protein